MSKRQPRLSNSVFFLRKTLGLLTGGSLLLATTCHWTCFSLISSRPLASRPRARATFADGAAAAFKGSKKGKRGAVCAKVLGVFYDEDAEGNNEWIADGIFSESYQTAQLYSTSDLTSEAEVMESYEAIIVGVSPGCGGADCGCINAFKKARVRDVPVAVFGHGASNDDIRRVSEAFTAAGAKLLGKESHETPGLLCYDCSDYEESTQKISAWVTQLRNEGMPELDG